MADKFQEKNQKTPPTASHHQKAASVTTSSPQTNTSTSTKKPFVSYKRYKTTKNIGLLVGKQLKNSTQKRGFAEGHLILNWGKVCPEYASFSAPTKLSHTGTLTITAASDSAKQEMMMVAHPLKERINAFLGHDSIIKMRFITGPIPKKTFKKQTDIKPSTKAVEQAEKTCQNLPKSDLKEALIRLGAQIYTKK